MKIERFVMFSTEGLENWEKEIIEAFPLLYKEPNETAVEWFCKEKEIPLEWFDKENPPEEFCNLRFGFEFGPEWKEVAWEFSQILSDAIKYLREKFHYHPEECFCRALIFKEKFDCLCWQGDYIVPSVFYPFFNATINNLSLKKKNT